MSDRETAEFDAAATRRDLLAIIGYSCETAAPNAHATTQFITDRWMQPRLDALVEYVRTRVTPPGTGNAS